MKWGDCKAPGYNTTTNLAGRLKLRYRRETTGGEARKSAGCDTDVAASPPREEQPDGGQAARLQRDPRTRLWVREQIPGTRKLAHLGVGVQGQREVATKVNQGLLAEQCAKVGKVVCPEHF